MKYFFPVLLIVCTIPATAQKNYEPTDTRKKNESFARLKQKELRADLATFTLAGIDESVGKDELKKLNFTAVGPGFMKFESDAVKAAITTAAFDPSKHKLDYDEKYLIKIDRKPYYGSYGSVPKEYISRLTVLVEKDTVAIPPAAYADLYNLNLVYTNNGVERSRNGIYYSKDGHRIYLYFLSKDRTGSYEVTWIIQDKKYLRRVLDYDFL